jgi:hypothetical protein
MAMDYKKLVKDIIDKDFPELKGKIVFVSEGKRPSRKFSAMIVYFIFFSWIIFHPKTKKYSRSALEAIAVHELSHLSIISNMNFFQKIKFAFGWIFTKKGKMDFERDADILTIKKGYGKGRIKAHEESSKTYNKKDLEKFGKKGYLSSKDIKIYMKEHNKK